MTDSQSRTMYWAQRGISYSAVLVGVGLSRWLIGPDDSAATWSGWLAVAGGVVLAGSLAVAFWVRLRRSA